eukprot:358264-Chlamydomonas_euryale.AAC.1
MLPRTAPHCRSPAPKLPRPCAPTLPRSATSVPGEYSDLAADEVGAARAYCLACNNAPSTADESAPYPAYPGKLPGFQTASSNQGKEAEYRAACGVCECHKRIPVFIPYT